MTLIDALPTFNAHKNQSAPEESRGAFKALLRDMEEDFLSKQPHDRVTSSEGTASVSEMDNPVVVAPTQVQVEQWIARAEINRAAMLPQTLYGATVPLQAAAQSIISETNSRIPLPLSATFALSPDTISGSAVADEAVAEAKAPKSLAAEIPLSEQGKPLQTSGLHLYVTAEGLGLSYRNSQIETRSGLEQVLHIKKLLAEQGKTVTEAYVNAQRIEFKGKENGD